MVCSLLGWLSVCSRYSSPLLLYVYIDRATHLTHGIGPVVTITPILSGRAAYSARRWVIACLSWLGSPAWAARSARPIFLLSMWQRANRCSLPRWGLSPALAWSS